MSMGGGSKGSGDGSSPETRQLAGISSRFEQEARPAREGALGQLAGILNSGADWLGPSMGGKSAPADSSDSSTPTPRKYTKADVQDSYSKYDIGKGQDVGRILGDLPDEFTLEELRSGANTKGLSGRSLRAWDSSVGELERTSRSGGTGMGGMSGGGAGGAMFLPIAQTAIERSRAATAQSVRGLTEQAAAMKGGGADNPFWQKNITQARMAGDQATSQIPSRIIEQYLTNVLPLAFGQSPVAVSGLSSAAGINAQSKEAEAQRAASGTNSVMGLIGTLAASAAKAYTMT